MAVRALAALAWVWVAPVGVALVVEAQVAVAGRVQCKLPFPVPTSRTRATISHLPVGLPVPDGRREWTRAVAQGFTHRDAGRAGLILARGAVANWSPRFDPAAIAERRVGRRGLARRGTRRPVAKTVHRRWCWWREHRRRGGRRWRSIHDSHADRIRPRVAAIPVAVDDDRVRGCRRCRPDNLRS